MATILIYFMSLNREARLMSAMESRVHERDQIIGGLPEEVQMFILSKLDFSDYFAASPLIRKKLFPECCGGSVANSQRQKQSIDIELLTMEKFKPLQE